MVDKNDWRLMGQEDYLMNAKLRRESYAAPTLTWDHDHCAFCSLKFSENEGDLHVGYRELKDSHWVCEECFRDFKEMFNFTVVE